ncbi:MAG: phosphoribosylformylglycinamidine synthase subunit PurL, partial [Chitinophagaceae bacterium]|nr:phosphoribosylformylglycinamidine synthase subunit PurL [Chitinophagaceae bacterium]
GMQDMGAAGLICSTAEMSAKGGVGMRIDLDKVPTRQQNMKAWELLLSESQERMLIVVENGREIDVKKIFDKWDLENSVIGEVTVDGLLSFYMHGNLEAQIPAEELVLGGGAPQYERAYRRPNYFNEIEKFDSDTIEEPHDLQGIAEQIIQLPSIASKRWVYNQYDSMVGTANATTNAPGDAATIVVKEIGKGLALTVDCNSRYVFADPHKGTMIAVAEAARNIVCSGGKPLGVTNCLNFGNPYDPEVYYQFVHAIKGMGEACRKFDTPVTGGNVSFYNQNPDGAVYPTPTIGMVGLIDHLDKRMTLDFKEEGDLIYVLGNLFDDLSSSEYLHRILGVEYSPAPYFDLDEEHKLHQKVLKLIEEGFIASAHDVSEGGLFVTLCESCFQNSLGFKIKTVDLLRRDGYLFGEAQGRVVVSVTAHHKHGFENLLHNFPYLQIGTVTDGEVIIDNEEWHAIDYWKKLYDTAIEKTLLKEVII